VFLGFIVYFDYPFTRVSTTSSSGSSSSRLSPELSTALPQGTKRKEPASPVSDATPKPKKVAMGSDASDEDIFDYDDDEASDVDYDDGETSMADGIFLLGGVNDIW
jgi:hypothetical protein